MPHVIERFGGKHGPLGRCIMFLPRRFQDIPNLDTIAPNIFGVADSTFKWMKDYNCSVEPGPVIDDFFYYHPNGTYEGPLGMIQRSEVDIVPYVARPDSLPFNPGIIGSVFAPSDVAIVFMRKNGTNFNRELISFVMDFPGIVYTFIFLALIIFVVSLAIMERTKDSKIVDRLSMKQVGHLFEQTVYALFDQEYMEAVSVSGRLVWLTLLIFIIVFINGIFLSKLGADLVVMKEPHKIESIEELIHNNSKTRPVASKQLFLMNLLKQAAVYRPESTLGRLYKVLMSSEDLVMNFNAASEDIDIDKINGQHVALFESMQRHEKAMLMPKVFVKMSRNIQCLTQPGLVRNMTIAEQTFAHGILTFIYAPKINPMVRRMVDYFIGTFFETALLRSFEKAIIEDNLILMPELVINRDVLQCQEGDIASALDEASSEGGWSSFTLIHYKKVFAIFAIMIAAALVALFIETRYPVVLVNNNVNKPGIWIRIAKGIMRIHTRISMLRNRLKNILG